jgi:phage repressor protein C with HTH and peptisase S24 domain
MDQMAVRRTLDELIRTRGEDYASLSRRIGRNQTYIQQFIKRGVPRRLSEEDRTRLAEYFAVPQSVLGGPPERAPRRVEVEPGKGFVLVRAYDVGASAGPGALAEEDAEAASIALGQDFVRSIASGRVEALSKIRVEGDSMLPTLANGDEIVVDTDDASARLRDGIYVLRVDGALLVKRLAINPAGRRLSINSDNPAYPSWPDCDPATVTVIGRVVWVGRRLS